MKIARQLMTAATAVAVAMQVPMAAAQSAPDVPDQPWYPQDYRDWRIAAALQVETFPRPDDQLTFEDYDNPGGTTYDLIDCDPLYDIPDEVDEAAADRMQLALDM